MTLFQNKLYYWLFMSFIAQYTITFRFLHISFHYMCAPLLCFVMCFCFVFKYIFFLQETNYFSISRRTRRTLAIGWLQPRARAAAATTTTTTLSRCAQQQRWTGESLAERQTRKATRLGRHTLPVFTSRCDIDFSNGHVAIAGAPKPARPQTSMVATGFQPVDTHTHRRIKRFMQTTAAVSETSTMALYCTQALYNM